MSATPVTIKGVVKHDDGSIEHVTITGFEINRGDPPPDPPVGPSHPDNPPPESPEHQ